MHMRRLLIVFFLFSSTAYAQSDVVQDMAELKQLVETQNRLIAEQSAQLRQLTDRVSELEGHSAVSEANATGLVAIENESLPPEQSAEIGERTEALDTDEIAQQHKQSIRTGKEAVIVDEAVALSDTMDIYGSMRLFTEMGAEDPSLNDGSSRLGIRLARDLENGRTLFGRIEWKVNLVDNDSQFVVSDSTSGGIVARAEDTDSALSTRLGYLGVRFENIGELSFGKQWSVYYDVAGWTDSFNVYGGAALSVFAAGTDGGALGSGRAEDAIIWRNARGKFSYGLQTQLKTAADGDDFEALGGSLIFAPNDRWEIGAAFAANRIEGAFEAATGDDNSGVATVGVRYHSGPWNTAFSIAAWDNHEAIFFEDDTLIYDGVGAELYVDYAYSDRLHIYGGFNYTDPDIDDPRVDPDFGVEHLLLGTSWFGSDESFGYLEALLSGGRDINGRHIDSVLSAGYRFDF
jgi:predicted porin/uncharacterized coiled-coil protein SlyX